MRILGIDPGTGRLGWALLEKERGREELVECGCLESRAHTPLPRRLTWLYEELGELIERFRPDEAAVEELFFATNAKTAMAVGAARGVALLVCEQAGLPAAGYSPMQIKSSVTGSGRADKRQVQEMVKQILRLPEIPRPDDAADAVAVALTHATGRWRKLS